MHAVIVAIDASENSLFFQILEDCAAMEQCSYCGVRFLATAHAWSVEDLHRRPVYRRLLQTGMFQTAVVLQPDQTYTVEELHTG